jgi:hypothetical protein
MKWKKPAERVNPVLSEQAIDASHPGWVLHDFQVVLDYLGTDGVRSSGKYNLLPIAAIGELDERLGRPLRLPLERPQVRSHPYLQGLNLLLRASGLGRVDGVGDKARLFADPATLMQWNALNPTERYFNLLEAWLRLGRPEMVGDRSSALDLGIVYKCFQVWNGISKDYADLRKEKSDNIHFVGIYRDFYNIALMNLFGLLDVDHPEVPAGTWVPAGVRRNPFGDAIMAILSKKCLGWIGRFGKNVGESAPGSDNEDLDTESLALGLWQPFFQPHFPAWRNNLEPPEVEVRTGTFLFRVALGKVWRRLAVPSETTLDELVYAILDSVDFDDYDHLYMWTYRDHRGVEVRVEHPYNEEGPYGTEVQVGALPLEPGQSMTLLYDFGDNWRFTVKLEKIDPPGPKKAKVRVVESHGKAPEQYPEWD